jgi:tetratricopeptide (TPR) repeat protein
MSKRTSGGAAAHCAAALIALFCVAQATRARAQQPAAPVVADGAGPGVGAPAGSDAAAQQAILEQLTVKNLIGDAVSLSNQAYPEVENAIQRFLNGDFDGAREFLEIARQKYPKLPPSDLTLAKMQELVRNGQAARVLLEKTVTEYPNDPEAYLLLADLAFIEGRTTEAHALFEKASKLTEAFTENEKRKQNFLIRVLAGLAAVHERRLQWADANALLAQWVELDPESAVARQRLGASLYRLEKPTEALEEFKKARELDAASNHPQIWLGQLYTQDGKSAEARAAFEQAYAAEPDNEGTARAYAEWLIQQNDLEKAQAVAAAMRKKSPRSVAALLLDGLVAKMRGQNDAAEATLMEVLGIEPNNSIATNLLALVLSESTDQADLERALGYAQLNAAQYPNSTQAIITYAWVLYQLGRVNEARTILQRPLQNPSPDAYYLIAKIMVAEKRPEQAASILDQIIKQVGTGMFMYRPQAEALLAQLLASGIEIPPAGVPAGQTVPPTSGLEGAAPATGGVPAGGVPAGGVPAVDAAPGAGTP